jgi:hypothetical protein
VQSLGWTPVSESRRRLGKQKQAELASWLRENRQPVPAWVAAEECQACCYGDGGPCTSWTVCKKHYPREKYQTGLARDETPKEYL